MSEAISQEKKAENAAAIKQFIQEVALAAQRCEEVVGSKMNTFMVTRSPEAYGLQKVGDFEKTVFITFDPAAPAEEEKLVTLQ